MNPAPRDDRQQHRDDGQLDRLERLIDAARRRYADDASSSASDEPTMHFAQTLLDSFESLGTSIRRYRYARARQPDRHPDTN